MGNNVKERNQKKIGEMKSIVKSFSEITILNEVNLSLYQGEVVALMGENGAGKSTLMKVLCGVHKPDSGEIIINDKNVRIINPRKAHDLGVRIVHQELSLIDHLTVAENIFLGNEPSTCGVIDHKKMRRLSQELLDKYGFCLDVNQKVKSLSIANKQLVEIAKATLGDAKIIILDEPTSALAQNEIKQLFEIINLLKATGVSIIYISHKLDEIIEVCERVVVLKDGNNSGESLIKDVTEEKIIQMMVGREVQYTYTKQIDDHAPVILEVEGLGNDVIDNVNFSLRKGEIIGVAGLMGSGRTQLLETLFGVRSVKRGTISIDGKPIENSSPLHAIKNRFAFVTEDRKRNGLVLQLSVKQNNTLPSLSNYVKNFRINETKRTKISDKNIKEFNIKASSINQKIDRLSGGNQQKVVLSKWVNTNPRVLLIDEPTRGVDVGAKAEIYTQLKHLTSDGLSIIMVSSELPEILAMSDRILIMNSGKVGGIIERAEATEEVVMKYAIEGVGN
ncbi:sugar ABC transporter ATP-binding protein [Peribacillus sp. NPDC058002]|uniref:sugar ABC transporter ATP-binding protein n=1 Tax=Peribacillus sp. NPDC058002 TaxID=3346301 RepID=UPI0036DEDA8C